MRKNTDLHLKTRTVTVKNRFWELPQVLREVQKKTVLWGHRNCSLWGFLGFSSKRHHRLGPLMSCLVLWWLSNRFPYIRLLRLPFPPYNGSPVNLNCLSGTFARLGSTPFPCAIISTASTGQWFRLSIFAAHANVSGTNTSALHLYSLFTCSSHMIFFWSLSISLWENC